MQEITVQFYGFFIDHSFTVSITSQVFLLQSHWQGLSLSSRACGACLDNNIIPFDGSAHLMSSSFLKIVKIADFAILYSEVKLITQIPCSCFSVISFFNSMASLFKIFLPLLLCSFLFLSPLFYPSCHFHYSLSILIIFIITFHVLVSFHTTFYFYRHSWYALSLEPVWIE